MVLLTSTCGQADYNAKLKVTLESGSSKIPQYMNHKRWRVSQEIWVIHVHSHCFIQFTSIQFTYILLLNRYFESAFVFFQISILLLVLETQPAFNPCCKITWVYLSSTYDKNIWINIVFVHGWIFSLHLVLHAGCPHLWVPWRSLQQEDHPWSWDFLLVCCHLGELVHHSVSMLVF